MQVTIISPQGIPLMCETEGCHAPASSAWSNGTVMAGGLPGDRQHYACDRHNPMSLPASLPWNFTSHTLCHACGQAVRF